MPRSAAYRCLPKSCAIVINRILARDLRNVMARASRRVEPGASVSREVPNGAGSCPDFRLVEGSSLSIRRTLTPTFRP